MADFTSQRRSSVLDGCPECSPQRTPGFSRIPWPLMYFTADLSLMKAAHASVGGAYLARFAAKYGTTALFLQRRRLLCPCRHPSNALLKVLVGQEQESLRME